MRRRVKFVPTLDSLESRRPLTGAVATPVGEWEGGSGTSGDWTPLIDEWDGIGGTSGRWGSDSPAEIERLAAEKWEREAQADLEAHLEWSFGSGASGTW